MPFVDLPTPPTPPQRDDPSDVFIERADDWLVWQQAYAVAFETFVGQLEATAALIDAAPAYADLGLLAMTGLTPAADTFVYFTSSNDSALTTITAAARSLLDDASTSDMLTTLGFSAFGKTIIDDADAPAARATIGAAALGPNTDITSLEQDVAIVESGTIAANTLGFRGIPGSAQTPGSGITLALSDAGKTVPNTSGGWTIPANASVAFPRWTAIVLYNDSASDQTIAITSDTLRLAGTAVTGSLTLVARGFATLVKVNTTEWVAKGDIA